MSTPRSVDPRANTPTLVSLVHLLVSRRVSEGVADAGHQVKPSYGAVFGQLGPGSARLTQLARGAEMSPQAMGELVDELETLGYVVRTPDPDDRRAKLITLTDAGREISEAGRDSVAALEKEITEALGERGHQQLRRLLVRLLEHG